MVEDTSELSIGHFLFMFINFFHEEWDSAIHFELILNSFVFASALIFSRIANDGVSSLSVVADGGEASRKEGNRISSNVDSSGFGNTIEPLSPLFVSHSWSSKSDNFNVIELTSCLDINIAEASQGTTQTNTCDDQSSGVDMFSKSFNDIASNCVPHAVHFLLDLASFGCFLVLPLNLIINLLGRPIEDLAKHSSSLRYIWRQGQCAPRKQTRCNGSQQLFPQWHRYEWVYYPHHIQHKSNP